MFVVDDDALIFYDLRGVWLAGVRFAVEAGDLERDLTRREL